MKNIMKYFIMNHMYKNVGIYIKYKMTVEGLRFY